MLSHFVLCSAYPDKHLISLGKYNLLRQLPLKGKPMLTHILEVGG